MTDMEQRQVPYALSNTLNDVAKLFQYRQQQHDASIFTQRRADWQKKSVKITQFAKKNDLVSSVAIEAPGDASRSDILGKFENQTVKLPHSGRSLAVPVNGKAADIIPKGRRPKAFNFHRVGGKQALNATHHASKNIRGGVGRGALEVYEGDKRTVMIRNAQGKGVVLQRVGSGKRAGMRVLFFLTPRVRLHPNLQFIPHAQEAAIHAKDFFAARFAEAMSTSRGA